VNGDKVSARRMVLVSMLLLALITTYKDRQRTRDQGPTKDTFRVFWVVGVVGMLLSILADFVPQIAGPFAGLVVLGSFFNGGEKVIEQALGVITPPASSSSRPAAPSAPGPGSQGASTNVHSGGVQS